MDPELYAEGMVHMLVNGELTIDGEEPDPTLTFQVGTEEDRAALFDDLVEKTLARDAFASLPHHHYYRAHPPQW